MNKTVIPNAFDDPNYNIQISSIYDKSCCDFCNRKNVLAATIWWTQPKVVYHPNSPHTFMVICINCIEEIKKKLLDFPKDSAQ